MRISMAELDGPMLDISEVDLVQIRIRPDGKVIWVNVEDVCRLRISRITGKIILKDERENENEA